MPPIIAHEWNISCQRRCEALKCIELGSSSFNVCSSCPRHFVCNPLAPDWHSEYDKCSNLMSGIGSRGRYGQSSHITNVSLLSKHACGRVPLKCNNRTLATHGFTALRNTVDDDERRALTQLVPSRLCISYEQHCRITIQTFLRVAPKAFYRLDAAFKRMSREGGSLGTEIGVTAATIPSFRRSYTDVSFARVMESEYGVEELWYMRNRSQWHVSHSPGVPGHTDGQTHLLSILLSNSNATECFANQDAVDACDSPAFRAEAVLHDRSASQRDDAVACCEKLAPGDAWFARENVAHSGDDDDRMVLDIPVLSIGPDLISHNMNEDIRCEEWVRAGLCHSMSSSDQMECMCPEAWKKDPSKSEL